MPCPAGAGFRAGSAADGHGIPASFSARAIRATLCPASRCANIHATTCAVPGSGSRRCARRPHAACALFGCGPASASRYLYGGRPPRYRPCRVCAAIAVRHPDAGPGDLPLGRQAQHRHRLLIVLGGVIDPAAGLGHPQLDPVVLEQRRHQAVLVSVERPLVFSDDDRVPVPVGVGERGDQDGGLRSPRPGHRAALPGIEELGHHPPVTADKRAGLRPLPSPRRHRILPVLGRHPPVKREPQSAGAAGLNGAWPDRCAQPASVPQRRVLGGLPWFREPRAGRRLPHGKPAGQACCAGPGPDGTRPAVPASGPADGAARLAGGRGNQRSASKSGLSPVGPSCTSPGSAASSARASRR